MQHRMIFVAVFSCFLASALSASVGTTSSEELDALDLLIGQAGYDKKTMIEKFQKSLAEQCRNETGSDEAYESIKTAPDTLITCALDSLNIEKILGEFETAMQTEKFDSLFTEGCDTTKKILPCIDSFLEVTRICMDEEEKQLTTLFMIVVRALLDFTCSRTVDDLEKIFNAKTDECILSKEDGITECAMPLVAKYFDGDEDAIIENALNLLTKEDNCVDLVGLETCAVPLFDDCSNKTPIEVARGLLRSVINQTPCRGMKEVQSEVANNEI